MGEGLVEAPGAAGTDERGNFCPGARPDQAIWVSPQQPMATGERLGGK